MVWTPVSVNSGAILPSSSMQALQNNFTAVAEAHSGAPQIQQAALVNSSVWGWDLFAWGFASAGGIATGSSHPQFALNAYAVLPYTQTPLHSTTRQFHHLAFHQTAANSAGQPRFSMKP